MCSSGRWQNARPMEVRLDEDGIRHFDRAAAEMRPLLYRLLTAPARIVDEHPSVPSTPGIYLFSEADRPVYVGQSASSSSACATTPT